MTDQERDETRKNVEQIADKAHRIVNGSGRTAGQRETVGRLSRALRELRDDLRVLADDLK